VAVAVAVAVGEGAGVVAGARQPARIRAASRSMNTDILESFIVRSSF
jgi:hypothetical protein